MKRFAFVRHGRKDGAMIAADQIAAIEDFGIEGLNELLPGNRLIILHLGSMVPRTAQTIRAFQKYLENQGYETALLMPPDKRFGSKEIFAKFPEDAKSDVEAGKISWLNVLKTRKIVLLKEIEHDILEATQEIFTKIKNGDLVISVGHTPMIEIAALHFNPYLGEGMSLKELTGFLFEEENGDIVPVQKIGW